MYWSVVIHYESGTSLAGEISPNPLQEDRQTQTRCRQKLEVYEGPGKPGAETAYLNLTALQYSKALAYYSHVSFIKVGEWIRW